MKTWNMSREKRWMVYERDGNICRYCGARMFYPQEHRKTIDHLVPSCYAGRYAWWRNSLCNLVTACNDCNNKKGNRILPGGCCFVPLINLFWSCEPKRIDFIYNDAAPLTAPMAGFLKEKI